MKLDLRGLELPVGETHLDASVDIGDLLVIVPADVALQVQGSAEVGEVDLPEGVGADGRNVESNLIVRRVLACSCSTPTSAPGACASSAPYDEPACRCPPSHRALTSA